MKRNRKRIIVEIQGGALVGVYASKNDPEQYDLVLLDWDEKENLDPDNPSDKEKLEEMEHLEKEIDDEKMYLIG